MAMISTSSTWPASTRAFRKASAGGQLEHPSEVNNSRRTAWCSVPPADVGPEAWRIGRPRIFKAKTATARANRALERMGLPFRTGDYPCESAENEISVRFEQKKKR